MSHLCVKSEETKSRMSGETTIIVLHQVPEIIANGDLDWMVAQEVTRTGGEEGGEGTGKVALSRKLI